MTTRVVKLLESNDPADWHEDPVEERLRLSLTMESGRDLVRQLYPFRARMLQRCVFNDHAAGYVFPYARTTWLPSMYPIQVLDMEGTVLHRWCFNSSEIEILPAE